MNYIIETKRLYLREMTIEDKDQLALILSDSESMKYYPHPFSEQEVINWINWNINNYKEYGYGLWGVILKETGEFIGDCGITMQNIENELFPEIGYHINKKYRRIGIASEAAKACMEYGFNNKHFTNMISYMKSTNIPSRGVAEKNGMIYQRGFKKEIHGTLVEDEVLYIMTAENYYKK